MSVSCCVRVASAKYFTSSAFVFGPTASFKSTVAGRQTDGSDLISISGFCLFSLILIVFSALQALVSSVIVTL